MKMLKIGFILFTYLLPALLLLTTIGCSPDDEPLPLPPSQRKPMAPRNLQVTVTQQDILLHWEDVSDNELGFVVYESAVNQDNFVKAGNAGISVNELWLHSRAPGTDFYYKVAAYNAGDTSDYCAVGHGYTDPVIAPANLRATIQSRTAIELRWEDNATTATGFKIERKVPGGEWSEIVKINERLISYVDTTCLPKTFYSYRVRGFIPSGHSDYSNEATELTQWVGIDRAFANLVLNIKSLTISSGNILAVVGTGGDIVMYTFDDGWPHKRISTGNNTLNCVAFSPDGANIAVAGDLSVQVFRLRDDSLLFKLDGLSQVINSVALSPDGQHVATAGSDMKINIWKLTDNLNPVTQMTGHIQMINSIAYSPDGLLIASGSTDNSVHVFNVSTAGIEYKLLGHIAAVNAVVFSVDGSKIVSGSIDRTVKVWSIPGGALQRTLPEPENWVWAVAISPNGSYIAATGEDSTMHVWSTDDGKLLRTSYDLGGVGRAISFSSNSEYVIAGGDEYRTKVLW